MNIHKDIVSLKGQIAYSKDKVNYKGTPDWEKKEFKGVLKDLLKKLKDTEKHYKRVQKLKEGTCGYGENGELGEEPAGPHLIKKKKIKEALDGKKVKKELNNSLKAVRKNNFSLARELRLYELSGKNITTSFPNIIRS